MERRPIEERRRILFGEPHASVRAKEIRNVRFGAAYHGEWRNSVILMNCLSVRSKEHRVVHLHVVFCTSMDSVFHGDVKGAAVRRVPLVARHTIEEEFSLAVFESF